MTSPRERNRISTTERILTAARRAVAEDGAGMSMRAVAREVGMVSSAVHRYFPTKETLITALIVQSYGGLADALKKKALQAASAGTPAQQWRALAHELRRWASSHPNEFQLIYGTPLPGYVAPPETISAATAVARPFLQTGATAAIAVYDDERLREQMTGLVDDGLAANASGAAAVLAELAALAGMLTLELGGHLVGTADPADALYERVVERQIGTLRLTDGPGG